MSYLPRSNSSRDFWKGISSSLAIGEWERSVASSGETTARRVAKVARSRSEYKQC